MLKWLAYYLSLPFLILLSLLPFWVLFRFSDLAFLILYYLLRYRRKVVMDNLRNAFPNKSTQELRRLHRKFFQHFCDLIVETVKSFTISRKSLCRRMVLDPDNTLTQLREKDQSAIVALGHYGNWEMAGLRTSLEFPGILYAIYRPLKNPGFDRLLRHARQRFGMGLYPMKTTLRGMLANRQKTTFTSFLTDQAPPPENAIWLTFLNQDTPVFAGTEKIARKLNYPVVFTTNRKIGRGRYRLQFEMLSEDPGKLKPGELTALHTRRLEAEILRAPAFWLWSHRRWKHERPVNRPNS